MACTRRLFHAPAAGSTLPAEPAARRAPMALQRIVLAAFLATGGSGLIDRAGNAAASTGEPALTGSPSEPVHDLPEGPLARSLVAFAAGLGVSVQFDAQLVEGLRAAALRGRYGAAAGFERLLEGSGLQAVERAPGTWVLRRVESAERAGPVGAVDAASPPAASGEAMLPPVRVSAASERALGAVTGYAARRSATALKTDTPLIETPQSLSVVGREEIDAKGMRELLDTLHYTPGVFARTWGHDDRGYEYMALRGFQNTNDFSHNYLDGLSQLDFIDIGPITEVYGMERVEVLRGPSSATFGRGDVAGVVNRVSKRPSLATRHGELQLQGGNFDHRQAALDVGDRLSDAAAFRVVALARRADDQARYPGNVTTRTERDYIAPSLLWQPDAATSLTLLASMVRHESGDDVGFLADANGQPTEVREGSPGYSRIRQEAWTIGHEFRHDFSETLSLRQNFRHADRQVDKRHIRPARLQPDGRTVTRGAVRGVGEMQQTSLDTFLEARLGSGSVRHVVLAGLDWTRLRGEEQEFLGSAPDLDLLNPVYLPVPEPVEAGDREGPYRLRAIGAYLQDQVRFGERWILTLSGRQDRTRAEAETSYGPPRARRDRATTGRAGLTWLPSPGWAPYVSYGTSFHPAVGAFDGFNDEPTRGRQWEAGVKHQPAHGKWLVTAAVFDLEKRNIVITDPVSGERQQVGRMRARGVELEAKGTLRPGLSTTASFTHTEVKGRTGTTWYVAEGKAPILTPVQQASLWLDYRVPEGPVAGMSVGLGARYVGKRWDDAANTRYQGGYTLFDASLRQDLDAHWHMALHATNLTGKRYYASRVFTNWLRGEERVLTATLAYRW